MKFLLIASVTLFSAFSFAKGGPCKEDRKTLCQGIEKGQGRIGRCLFKNWDKVSPTCKTKRQAGFDRWNKKQVACGADITKFCKDSQPGEGRQGKCLRQNKKDLTPSCTAFLK